MQKSGYNLGLIGYPLEGSLSPVLHQAALRNAGLPGEYHLFPVSPLPAGSEELIGQVEKVRNGEVQGLNVTVPHKQSVIPYLDRLSQIAQTVGAVNTIYLQDALVIGDNTDVRGFQEDFQRTSSPFLNTAGISNKLALVLGAGGAARAVVFALQLLGFDIVLTSRRMEKAYDLVDSYHSQSVVDLPNRAKLQALPLDTDLIRSLEREKNPNGSLVIVNATSAGMFPNSDESPWPNGLPFPDTAFVYDLVYKPINTKFLKTARALGLPTAGGIGMLVEQAALSFERWTGVAAQRNAMWLAVNEALELTLPKHLTENEAHD